MRRLAHHPIRVWRSHRHLLRAHAAAVTIALASVAILVAGSFQLASGRTPIPTAVPTAEPIQTVAPQSSPVPHPFALPTLPKLRSLIRASVLVTSTTPLAPELVRKIVDAAGANASFSVAAGEVALGRGRTRALAADPVKMRVWTPPITGRAVAVWQRGVIGEAVVAHAVAKADAVRLGAAVIVQGRGPSLRLRAGAFATTQLPGVGLVVNSAVGNRLGLTPGTGLLLAVPDTDPAVTAAVVTRLVGDSATVEPVLSSEAPTGSWVPPTIGPVTSPFGMRIHPITQQPEFHAGIDIGAPVGTPVYAMTDGQVLYAGAASGFGNEIALTHAGGVTTIYGHVSQIFVSSGPVKVGQVIALVGNEGESTGPHLHAEIHVQDVPVDPVAWLEAHGVRFTH